MTNRLLLGALVALAGCGDSPPVTERNLLLVTIDTLRADRLGAYGYGAARTPNLDALAAGGVLFESVTAQVPVTLPSHASLFTGLVPPTHGVRDNITFRLDEEAETLAEILGAHGYETAAFVGAYVLDRSFGLDQGFDLYDDEITEAQPSAGTIAERKGELVREAFTIWLEQRKDPRPFFAWIHLFDPHLPYAPPSPYPASYDGEIAYVDEQIGRILEALGSRGLEDDTLVVVTSDHGESLGEHGEKSHGFFIYDATLRVPLILRGPRTLPAGRRISSEARSIDVLPTVLEMLDLPVPAGLQGHGLRSAIDEGPESDLPAYAECYVSQLTFGWAPLLALREGGYKYIEAPRPELYHLETDPGETENLVESEPDRARQMRSRLRDLLEEFPGSLSARHQPDPETIERLRSLGYAGSGGALASTAAEESLSLADPKDRLHLWTRLEEVILHQAAGESEPAVTAAREVLQQDPSNLLALELLAGLENRAGRRDEAISLYREIVRLDDSRPLSHLLLGNLLWESGDLKGAEASFAAALDHDPRFTRAHRRMGELYLATGRPEKALERFEDAADRKDSDPRVRLGLARSLRASGKAQEALRELEALKRGHPGHAEILAEYAAALAEQGRVDEALSLLASAPPHHDLHYTRSVLLRSQDRMEEALSELDAALVLEPGSAVALHDRGVLLSRMGRLSEAVETLQRAVSLRESPSTRNALGTALCRMERCAEAIPHFERAVSAAPEFLEALENLAQAYWITGRAADAERAQARADALK